MKQSNLFIQVSLVLFFSYIVLFNNEIFVNAQPLPANNEQFFDEIIVQETSSGVTLAFIDDVRKWSWFTHPASGSRYRAPGWTSYPGSDPNTRRLVVSPE